MDNVLKIRDKSNCSENQVQSFFEDNLNFESFSRPDLDGADFDVQGDNLEVSEDRDLILSFETSTDNIVELGDLVEIDYTITLTNGILIDTSLVFEADHSGILDISREYKPLRLIVGMNTTLPGLEKALVGMHVNEHKTVLLQPKDAYGEIDENKFKKLNRAIFSNAVVGEQVIIKENDKYFPAYVYKIDDDYVYLNLNSPLAGKEVVVSIKLRKIIKKRARKIKV